MKIFAISIVKNEADIIAYNLRKASEWADKIFVMDNGSTDGTWQIVQSMKNDIITPWKVDTRPFGDHLRGDVFNHFRQYAQKGDWWCIKLDADEFYIDSPKDFLPLVPDLYHVVFTEQIEYHLTVEDLEEFQYEFDFEQNQSKINYYRPDTWAEFSFFKYRPQLIWPATAIQPKRVGLYYPEKIRVKHYKYRRPQQIQSRIDTRKSHRERGFWTYEKDKWQDMLRRRSDLIQDTKDGIYHTTGCRNSNQHRWVAYWMKRFLHGVGIWP